MKSFLLGCIALAAAAGATPAAANPFRVDFTIQPGSWVVANPGTLYGSSTDPTINGSVTIDTSLSGAAAFTAITYATGTRVWTLADIDGSQSGFFFNGPQFVSVNFTFFEAGGFNYFYSNNTVGFLDPGDNSRLICSNCVNVTNVVDLGPAAPVPEPATWALLLTGFGAIGAALRRRRHALA